MRKAKKAALVGLVRIFTGNLVGDYEFSVTQKSNLEVKLEGKAAFHVEPGLFSRYIIRDTDGRRVGRITRRNNVRGHGHYLGGFGKDGQIYSMDKECLGLDTTGFYDELQNLPTHKLIFWS